MYFGIISHMSGGETTVYLVPILLHSEGSFESQLIPTRLHSVTV